MTRRRVVVTGLGVVSPVGSSVDLAWANILAGKSGIVPITHYDVSAYTTKFAGLVSPDFKAEEWMGVKELRKTDPFIHYGVAAAKQALRDSGLEITDANRERIAVTIGSGIGGIGSIEDECRALHEKGPKRVSPFFVPSSIINMVAGYVSIEMGITGGSFATVSACTTAAHSIGMAHRMISYGDAEVVVAGGAECGSAPAGMAGFCQARALSTRNDDPTRASRPFDKDRDGFVLGDGAGVLVLEEYEFAKARGARIYAELIGFGMSSDAYHITLPPEDGNGARRAMQGAMKDAGLNPEQVDYVNAHGTSTPAGDGAETTAVKAAFGDHARKLPVSSTKSMTGHLLGAAGGIEAVFSILAIRDQVLPPTINLDNPSEGCDLDYVPHTARPAKVEVVLSNSFGFGGTNGTLAFRRL
ncbi:beta-ketoacyl-[acyl-carrier-protein] synthase II [Stagnimonas aquatica]|uniref:3-oxoacyl-[acyl-carrier-protein] synthase 2 n=1 Tax=Stagnimonas aquatica TaxID=2689987 RepID=A0A3N0VA12_9GAMM|nr:beta-ketoacyl-ACP synthase II [Stagnimonas aquatica]ROH89623.1 beta-ketoacyl-[acyl-carrier-protein] synthase II [Stagnimonas aquatica]